MPELSKTPEERFWEKVNKDGPNGCWVWTAGTTRGYGAFEITRYVPGTRTDARTEGRQ